jgi:hypothetical protein
MDDIDTDVHYHISNISNYGKGDELLNQYMTSRLLGIRLMHNI